MPRPPPNAPEQDPSTSKPYTDACGVPGNNAWNNVNPAATDCSWSGVTSLASLISGPPEGCDYVVVRGDCMQDLYTTACHLTVVHPLPAQVRGDCMQDLYIQMLSYTLAKPVRPCPPLTLPPSPSHPSPPPFPPIPTCTPPTLTRP